ncbi:hypothetical protein BBP40_005501 [Aspergillus hancockii]|nr:hypothetical protein BBP40_005501 [Aspergillus hancockii]
MATTQPDTNLCPEILEAILLELDMRTLLTSAQRVCQAWKTLITESPSIQQALFFQPVADQTDSTMIKRCNPLLAENFPQFFSDMQNLAAIPPEISLLSLEFAKDPTRRAAFLYEKASWRQMLIQQPPVRALAKIGLGHGPIGEAYHRYILENKDHEIRMNVFYDLIVGETDSLQVFWWGNGPTTSINRRDELGDLWKRTLSTCDVILSTFHSSSCIIGTSKPLTPEEEVQKQITFPARDWGTNPRGFGFGRLNLQPDAKGMVRRGGMSLFAITSVGS